MFCRVFFQLFYVAVSSVGIT